MWDAEEKQMLGHPHRSWLGCTDRHAGVWREDWMREENNWFLFWTSHVQGLEKGMATHSSLLAWRIPWTEEPGGLQSMGPQRIGYNWACACTRTYKVPKRQPGEDATAGRHIAWSWEVWVDDMHMRASRRGYGWCHSTWWAVLCLVAQSCPTLSW